jgi:N-acetylglucosaminyl-diphospho-decaprenol L-rhamnosyltransferase
MASTSARRTLLKRLATAHVAALPCAAMADAAVLLVNHRTPELVERCLDAVERTRGGLELERVVVDNGAESLEALSALPVRLIAENENRGFAAGVNLGMAATEADPVLLLNPDTEVRPGAIAALLAHLEAHPHTGVAAPLLVHAGGAPQANAYRRFPGLGTLFVELCIPVGYALARSPRRHPYALPAGTTGPVAHAYGAALAIRRSAYERAGPLDEGFFLYLEETEWQRRVRAAGYEVQVVPGAVVEHLVRGGGEAALAPSPHFLDSAMRYLVVYEGRRPATVRLVLRAALLLSTLALGLIALVPAKRARARRQARAYAVLLRRPLRA